jgi:hypothetical protein
MYDQIQVFGMNKQNVIFPIWLVVKIKVNILGELHYIGLIKEIKKDKDYILMNEYGDI